MLQVAEKPFFRLTSAQSVLESRCANAIHLMPYQSQYITQRAKITEVRDTNERADNICGEDSALTLLLLHFMSFLFAFSEKIFTQSRNIRKTHEQSKTHEKSERRKSFRTACMHYERASEKAGRLFCNIASFDSRDVMHDLNLEMLHF